MDVPINLEAAEDDDSDNGEGISLYDVWTVPRKELENSPKGWELDPAYDGMTCPSIKATERDDD